MESRVIHALSTVADDELLRQLSELVSRSHSVEADLVAHIGEVDARRLFARFAFPSMFAYCTEGLRLSEAEAYRRITVARAARRMPVLLAMLRDGRLHLSGIATLVPFLTADNCAALLERATRRSKRELEELVAELSPRPDVAPMVRSVPERRPGPPAAGDQTPIGRLPPEVQGSSILVPGRVPSVPGGTGDQPATEKTATLAATPRVIEPLSPGRYKVQFTASAALRDKIERLTELMRSEIPDGNLAAVIERAVTEKLERVEARRFGKAAAPRKTLAETNTESASRHIPAAVRRVVSHRDAWRCRFVDEQGLRCSERARLEFHHRLPFGMGGDHSPGNLSLLCPQHNRYLAERDYGRAAIRRRKREA
jgi:hypothetical protein